MSCIVKDELDDIPEAARALEDRRASLDRGGLGIEKAHRGFLLALRGAARPLNCGQIQGSRPQPCAAIIQSPN